MRNFSSNGVVFAVAQYKILAKTVLRYSPCKIFFAQSKVAGAIQILAKIFTSWWQKKI